MSQKALTRKAIKAEKHALNRLIAANIKHYRQLYGLTQLQVSHILGCTVQQVQKYENNINRISVAGLIMLSRALKLQVYHFYRQPEPQHISGEIAQKLTERLQYLPKNKQDILLHLADELAYL